MSELDTPFRQVLQVAHRVWQKGETVPASERIFSIFEDHVELIKRGRRHKPVEFGHMVLLGQSPEKFITQYDVMEKLRTSRAVSTSVQQSLSGIDLAV